MKLMPSLIQSEDPAAPPAQNRSALGLVTADGRAFPLTACAIQARAEGGLAASCLVQTYTNPYPEPLEALYTLPLPVDGAVTGYTITLGDRIIRGEVQKNADAREAYARALEEGRTAGLLEQVRADTFSQELGSLPPGQEARVEIQLLHPLAFLAATETGAAASWEYRFPTVAGVRYHGAPGRIPDAAQLSPDRTDAAGTPLRLDLNLLVVRPQTRPYAPQGGADQAAGKRGTGREKDSRTAGPTTLNATRPDNLADAARPTPGGRAPALAFHAPGHEILAAPCEEGYRISLAAGTRLNRDVVVRWPAAGQEMGLTLLTGPGLPGDEGRYGLLTLTPPEAPRTTLARDLTILMDASGSMSGKPLEQSKRLVDVLLDSLGSGDRFELLAFSDAAHSLTHRPLKATPRNIKEARRRLGRLQAGGATEMAGAIIAALKPLRSDAQRQVILLTDGYIGFETEVIRRILEHLEPSCRLHAVGVGSAPNRSLIQAAARAGHGVELHVDETESVNEAAGRLLQATVGPVLTGLSVGGTALKGVVPARIPDVFTGRPLLLSLELVPEGGSLTLEGCLAGRSRCWTQQMSLPPLSEDSGPLQTTLPLGALYGREAVADCEMRLAAGKETEFGDQIEALGLRHKIPTGRTSLVALAEEPSVDPSRPRRRHRLPVEFPAGVSAEGTGYGGVSFSSQVLCVRESPAAYPLTVEPCVFPDAGEPAGISSEEVDPLSDESLFRARQQGRPSRQLNLKDLTALMVEARLIRVQDQLLVLELEAPLDGFLLPVAGAALRVHLDGVEKEAQVDSSLSTQPGPHQKGLTLRLALRLDPAESWPPGTLTLTWDTAPASQSTLQWGKTEHTMVVLKVARR